MSGVINLNKLRKVKTREKAAQRATENAVKFGRTKAQKQADRAQAAKQTRHLDLHKIDP